MGALKHLLDAPPSPAAPEIPDTARVERAVRGTDGHWIWRDDREQEINGDDDWEALLRDIGQRRDRDTPYRARWTDRSGKVRRSAHFPVWQRPSS